MGVLLRLYECLFASSKHKAPHSALGDCSRGHLASKQLFADAFRGHIENWSPSVTDAMFDAMSMRGDFISEWMSVAKMAGLSPRRDTEFWESVNGRISHLLDEHNMGAMSKRAMNVSAIFTRVSYPRSQMFPSLPSAGAVTFDMLGIGSLYLVDMLFDDLRELFNDTQHIRDTLSSLLEWFDGLSRNDTRSPSSYVVANSSPKLVKMFEETCSLMRVAFTEARDTLSSSVLKITTIEYRRQVDMCGKEALAYFESPEPSTVQEYLEQRIHSFGGYWCSHTRLHTVAKHWGFDDCDALERFWETPLVQKALIHASEYCALINDAFSFERDYKDGVTTPVKLIGRKLHPNSSLECEQRAGFYGTLEVIEERFLELMHVLHKTQTSMSHEKELVNIWIFTVLYQCFGTTMLYLLSKRYSFETCHKFISERPR